MPELILTLFITGYSSRSQHAVQQLQRLLQGHSRAGWELRIVDVLERPELAERYGVVATPTLVRERPAPQRRFIGDLSDIQVVMRGLELEMLLDQSRGGVQ